MSFSYVRALLFTDPLIILATAVMGTISLATSLFDSTGRAQHAVARVWARMLLFISRARVTVEGLEKIAPGGSYVIVSNHLSLMDTPLLMAYIPVEFRFLAKQGLFKVPFIGYHLRRAGHISVPRADARGSVRVMTQAARIIRERGVSILVFPEGGRSEGVMTDFREGAAYIAIKSGVPAVPVAVEGTREILPMGSLHVRGGKVSLRIGEPIPTSGLSLHDRAALTRQLRERILELVARGARQDSAAPLLQ